MNERQLQGASRRKGIRTTVRDRDARPAPDLVDRKFVADAPNKLWVADITYIPTYAGFLFLAIVLDAFSRRVVGWATSSNMRTQLVLDALNMAIWRRKPVDVVHHSDQGTQYTSIAFGSRCREANIRPSMGSVGDCYDNAMCESFNATLECELLDKHRFRTHKEAELAIFDFIEGWYNLHRRHSALGYRSPAAFERETPHDFPISNYPRKPGSFKAAMGRFQYRRSHSIGLARHGHGRNDRSNAAGRLR
jgi:putative transposase